MKAKQLTETVRKPNQSFVEMANNEPFGSSSSIESGLHQ